MASVVLSDFQLLTGADKLTLYQWNTCVAEHYFCSVCGSYTHHRRRSKPNQYAINVACLNGPDVTKWQVIGMFKGALNSVVVDGEKSG